MAEKHYDYMTKVPREYSGFQDLVSSVKAEIAEYNLPPIIKDASPLKSPQSLAEEEKLKKNLIQELQSEGINKKAKVQVGDATTILEVDKWRIIVTNQRETGIVVVVSHILPESFKWPNKARIFSITDIDLIKKSIGSPNFNGREELKATKELFEYRHRFSPATPNEPFSPVQLCIEELKARMTHA